MQDICMCEGAGAGPSGRSFASRTYISSAERASIERLLLLAQGMTRRRCARMLGATDTLHQSKPLSKALAHEVRFNLLMMQQGGHGLLLFHLLWLA